MAERSAPRKRTASTRVSAEDVVERATRVLADLGGMNAERVIGVESDDEGSGWRVTLQVVEVHRVPDTADILAVYEVTIGRGGQFEGYRQVGRHVRGRLEDPR